MTKLSYFIDIAATPERVWQTITGEDTYCQWTRVWAESSRFIGKWTQAAEIDFVDASGAGTRARLDIFDHPHAISFTHIAMLGPDRTPDTTSDLAQLWIGGTESFQLTANPAGTHLLVQIRVHEQLIPEDHEDDSWPKALDAIKQLAEA